MQRRQALQTGRLVIVGLDLARATGQDDTLDEEMCRTLYEGMLPMEEVLRSSGQYGGHVDVPADADVQTRLLALIGRRA